MQEIKQFIARLPHMLATKQSLAKRKFLKFYLIILIVINYSIIYFVYLFLFRC